MTTPDDVQYEIYRRMYGMTETMKAWRQLHPYARRTKPTAIVHSGNMQTIRTCICGSTHTESTKHRGQTKHVREWLEAHSTCADEWFADAMRNGRISVNVVDGEFVVQEVA